MRFIGQALGDWTCRVRRWPAELLGELAPTHWQAALADADLTDWSPTSVGCPRCGITCGPGGASPEGCSFCLGNPLPWDRLVRLEEYRKPVDLWIRRMKFQRHWSLAEALADRLADRIARVPVAGPSILVPVPMHWRRRWHRGYDQTWLMTRRIAGSRRWPIHRLLRRIRHTPPQATLAPSARRRNVRGAFALSWRRPSLDWSGTTIWLVDDVKTTGATLTACARLLRQLKPLAIHVAVIAVTHPQRRSGA